MFPGITRSPPNRLTPKRCAFESRPLRVEPAPFLDAKSWRSKTNIAARSYQAPRARGNPRAGDWFGGSVKRRVRGKGTSMAIALFGTGMMGSGMAERWLRGGQRVTVWNRTAEKTRPLAALGATVAADPL